MSDFHRRQYETLARAIGNSDTIDHLVNILSYEFTQDNPRFKDDLFRFVIAKTRIDGEYRAVTQELESSKNGGEA